MSSTSHRARTRKDFPRGSPPLLTRVCFLRGQAWTETVRHYLSSATELSSVPLLRYLLRLCL